MRSGAQSSGDDAPIADCAIGACHRILGAPGPAPPSEPWTHTDEPCLQDRGTRRPPRPARAARPAGERAAAGLGLLQRPARSSVPAQRVAFGTSGHRGSSFDNGFNEWHVLAISQAICDYRRQKGIDGPLFLGIDTHALSTPAFNSAVEVLAANGVELMLSQDDEYTPTPAVSHAILVYNRGRSSGLADGIVITPAQPARERRLQVQPAQRRPGRHRHHLGGRGRRQRLPGQRPAGREAAAAGAGASGLDHAPARLPQHLCGRPGAGARHGRHPRRADRAGRRSAGRRGRALLARDRRALQARA